MPRVILGRIRFPVVLFGLVVVTGTVGYRELEGWTWLESLWMTVITLTTVGYAEVHPMSDAGRLFTLGLLLGGIAIVSYAIAELTRYVAQGDLRRDLEARRWRRTMDHMHDHHVVVGYGRLGREVAFELRFAGQPVLVVESQPAAADQAERDGFVVVRGDATSDDTLRAAQIERARDLAIATSSNASNVFVTLSARQLAPDLLILTRVDDEEAARKALRAGANHVLSPQGIGGSHMAHALLRPHARAFLDLAMSRASRDLEIGEVHARGAVRTLSTLAPRERHGILVVAIRRADGRLINVPGPDDALGEGDVAIVIGRPEQVKSFAEAVG